MIEYAILCRQPKNYTHPDSEIEAHISPYSHTYDRSEVEIHLKWLQGERRHEIRERARLEEEEARASRSGLGSTNAARLAWKCEERSTYSIVSREITPWEEEKP